MEKILFLNVSRDYLLDWLENYTRPAHAFPIFTDKGAINLLTIRKSSERDVWEIEMLYSHIDNGKQITEPALRGVSLKILHLNSERVELIFKCPHPALQDFCAKLLTEIENRWSANSVTNKALMEKLSDFHLDLKNLHILNQRMMESIESQQKNQIEKIRELIQYNRLEQGEIEKTLDAIRRVLKVLLTRESTISLDIRQTLEEQNKLIKMESNLQQKFELTIPVIPYFLAYKIEWASEIGVEIDKLHEEVKNIWQQLLIKTD